ncbi:MAG: hypothetical protein GTO22_02775, partial [Gemmatimonadales bacterium]|nr:hypothetical protein [Gemmatimonadales bacterium]NIQ19952.1 hypothetical protein [Gammaproteobacteria bacterium]
MMQEKGGAAESSMAKQWYIVHTYSGHETKAMQALLERAKAMGKEDMFDEVL